MFFEHKMHISQNKLMYSTGATSFCKSNKSNPVTLLRYSKCSLTTVVNYVVIVYLPTLITKCMPVALLGLW